MSVAARLALFAVGVAAAFGIGFGVGDLAGPFGDGAEERPAPIEEVHDEHGS